MGNWGYILYINRAVTVLLTGRGPPCKIQIPSGPSMYPRPKIHLAKGVVHQRREIYISSSYITWNLKQQNTTSWNDKTSKTRQTTV